MHVQASLRPKLCAYFIRDGIRLTAVTTSLSSPKLASDLKEMVGNLKPFGLSRPDMPPYHIHKKAIYVQTQDGLNDLLEGLFQQHAAHSSVQQCGCGYQQVCSIGNHENDLSCKYIPTFLPAQWLGLACTSLLQASPQNRLSCLLGT